MNAAGPTNGNIVLRDGKTTPKSVGIIHCVGSRDKNFNNYCSVICCMQGLKFAHLVHERTGATVYNFYIDMRTAYKAYDEFYQRVLEEGTLFVRGKVAEVTDAARGEKEKGKLIIQVEDTLASKQRRIPVDMVILSSGLQPRNDAKEVGKMFGISCSTDGWFTEKHPKLDPMATMTEGIYIAGCAQGPKDIPSSVAQGAAASARVLEKILQRKSRWNRSMPLSTKRCAQVVASATDCARSTPSLSLKIDMVTEINPALMSGMWYLCGGLPGRCDQRHGI